MMGSKVLVAVAQALILFHDDKILGVRLPDGRIGATLLSLCRMLKIAKHGQMERIRRDEVLSKHLLLVIIETARGPQAVEVLIAQAIPTWLTGLQSSMVAPEKRPMILALKEEAVEVLYRHFFHVDPEPAPPPEAERPKTPPDSAWDLVQEGFHLIGDGIQMLKEKQQATDAHVAAFVQWQEVTEERQQAMGEHLAETMGRVTVLEERLDDAPGDMAGSDRPSGSVLLSQQHLGQVYVLARAERSRSGTSVNALLVALAQEFGVADMSDLPDSAWNEVLDWFWQRKQRR